MPFLFCELPAELRIAILRLLLTHNTPIIAYSCNDLRAPQPFRLDIHPDISLASRALHAEANAILYGENTFQAHPTYLTSRSFAMNPHQPVLSSHCISRIKKWHVRVRLDVDPYYSPAEVAQTFSNMSELEVEVFRASWGLGTYDALEGFTKVRGVGKAKVHGSLANKYARWLEQVMMSAPGTNIEEWQHTALPLA
ncbi:MAG: hypothetical protein L6R37_005556 [Teloschistes peruensis]|nr:MAG: hypothetical protein L6R37_005556 [Teloschistes peruensis]